MHTCVVAPTLRYPQSSALHSSRAELCTCMTVWLHACHVRPNVSARGVAGGRTIIIINGQAESLIISRRRNCTGDGDQPGAAVELRLVAGVLRIGVFWGAAVLVQGAARSLLCSAAHILSYVHKDAGGPHCTGASGVSLRTWRGAWLRGTRRTAVRAAVLKPAGQESSLEPCAVCLGGRSAHEKNAGQKCEHHGCVLHTSSPDNRHSHRAGRAAATVATPCVTRQACIVAPRISGVFSNLACLSRKCTSLLRNGAL